MSAAKAVEIESEVLKESRAVINLPNDMRPENMRNACAEYHVRTSCELLTSVRTSRIIVTLASSG